MLRKYKNGHRGTVCIKKVIQKSSYFLTQGIVEVRVYVGPREEQDVYQSHGTPHPNRGIYKISGGMTSFHSCGIGFRRRGIEQQFGVM